MNLVFATGNEGKLKEVKRIFENTGFVILSKKDFEEFPEVEEDRITFEENAIKKAREIYEVTGIPAVADDSGLMVDQLNGEPGVYSARYAGENCTYDDNNNKLIAALKDLPAPHAASFVTYAAYYDGEKIIVAVGRLKGEIINEKSGEMGFGYDPVFIPDGYNTTLANFSPDDKNRISHRGKAFNKLKEMLTRIL